MRLFIPLFSPPTGSWGGLTRVLALAQASQQAGHTVSFCAADYLEANLRQRGFQVCSMPASTMFGLPKGLSRVMEKRSQRMTIPVKPGKSIGNIWFVQMLSGMARMSYLKQLVKAQLAAIDHFRPDVVVTDLDLGGYLSASISGVPLVAIYQDVMRDGVGSLPWQIVNRSIGRVLKSYGREPVPVQDLGFGSQVLKIIPSIPELDGAGAERPDRIYTGSLLGDIQPGKPEGFRIDPAARYLYIYVGTGSISQDMLRSVLPGFLSFHPGLKAMVGGVNLTATESVGNVDFRSYIPANDLLPHCDWTICHGGQNTIIQSLLHGVPLLVFPGPIFERRFNGGKVEETGVGLMGEIPDFNPLWLQAALERQPGCAARAKELGKQVLSYGGAARAIQAISEWLKSR